MIHNSFTWPKSARVVLFQVVINTEAPPTSVFNPIWNVCKYRKSLSALNYMKINITVFHCVVLKCKNTIGQPVMNLSYIWLQSVHSWLILRSIITAASCIKKSSPTKAITCVIEKTPHVGKFVSMGQHVIIGLCMAWGRTSEMPLSEQMMRNFNNNKLTELLVNSFSRANTRQHLKTICMIHMYSLAIKRLN